MLPLLLTAALHAEPIAAALRSSSTCQIADNILHHMLAETPDRLTSDEEEAPPAETRAAPAKGRSKENGAHAHRGRGASREAAAPSR